MNHLPLWLWPFHRQLLTVLIFHRVLPAFDPLRPGEITAVNFDAFMNLLSRHCVVLPLVEAVERLQHGTLPRRACCITFDDGYADNLTVAVPILDRYHLPATVFVATDYLDGGRMFNDSIIEIVARSAGERIDLGKLDLDCYGIATLPDRLQAIVALQEKLKYMPPAERDAMIAAIAAEVACGELPDNLMLTSAQVIELHRAGVEIGGHTVAHTILSTLDDDQAQSEITGGKRHLESLIGQQLRVFAYPNGRPNRDMTLKHTQMVRNLGFQTAVTTSCGVANNQTDLFQLPRLTPWGGSLLEITGRMTRNAWMLRPAVVCK